MFSSDWGGEHIKVTYPIPDYIRIKIMGDSLTDLMQVRAVLDAVVTGSLSDLEEVVDALDTVNRLIELEQLEIGNADAS